MQCVSFGRSAPVALAIARARPVQQREPAADPGIPGANDRRAAQRGFDRRPCASAGRYHPLQPRTHRNHKPGGFERNVLRMLPGRQGTMRPAAEAVRLAILRKQISAESPPSASAPWPAIGGKGAVRCDYLPLFLPIARAKLILYLG